MVLMWDLKKEMGGIVFKNTHAWDSSFGQNHFTLEVVVDDDDVPRFRLLWCLLWRVHTVR